MSLGFGLGVAYRHGGLPPFDPNTLLASGVYGDFMRVSESVPASSGGLLTRWSGQRDDTRFAPGAGGANDDWGFDIGPFSSAPAVGAYGPNGEQAIRFSANTWGVGSKGRGGVIQLDAPYPPFTLSGLPPYPHVPSTAFTVGCRFKVTGLASLTPGNRFSAGLADDNYFENSIHATQAYNHIISSLVVHGITDATWATLVFVWNGTNVTVYKDGVALTPITFYTQSLYRWLFGQWGGGGATTDIASRFMGAVAVGAADAGSLTAWLEG